MLAAARKTRGVGTSRLRFHVHYLERRSPVPVPERLDAAAARRKQKVPAAATSASLPDEGHERRTAYLP